jgi:hypothetical protein
MFAGWTLDVGRSLHVSCTDPMFGEIAADERNFSRPIEEIADNPEWRESLGIEGRMFNLSKI